MVMKTWLRSIYQNWYFLLFILLFAYVQSIYMRISVRQAINVYTFTPEAAVGSLISAGVLFLIIRFFIGKWQRSAVFNTSEMLKIFGSSLVAYILVIQASGLFIAFIFDNIERNFNQQTVVLSTLSIGINGLTYGSFFLAYYYYSKNKTHQEQLAAYNHAFSENKINQLKAQLNPHFLFNNLNVLDQLIEEDKHKASDFLNEFADIYRYVLQASDKKLVSINEELAFAKQYVKLIQHKYGHAYRLTIEGKDNGGFIAPLTLQLLIENAVDHNLGSAQTPVCITIGIGEEVTVTNNIILKSKPKLSGGRSLRNLREQYVLLSDEHIRIHQNETQFSICIPIIQRQHI